MPLLRPAILVLTALLLAACGKDGATSSTQGPNGETDGTLPVPAGASGSVTGMPNRPGPGPVGVQGVEQPPTEVALDADGNPLPVDGDGMPVDGAAVEGVPEGSDEAAGEPTANDAVAVLRDYFAAINSGNFARAYALWADGGRASGQSPQGFADGFADTTGLSVELMPPGRVDAAAGSRYVEVPVTLRANLRDGGERRLTGAFTLRRAVVDGATAEQRAWRIATADLRDVAP
ncbi:hypothetical protein [Aerolutibacter daejeonensis]|uniref:hypothetical protein n=1 Tax=Aerolutibacter daejeonensis TaxID=346181 RepID=UPI0012EC2EBB|nr:hypothetical protein [Lysobacter daejeonensis]